MNKIEDISWRDRAIAAEKTVEILADKVTGLLNGSQNLVQKQLERAKLREEKNLRRQAVMETRNEALERHSMRLENQISQRTSELRAILDNVTFGFLLINQDFRIMTGFTRSCYKLLGTRKIAGHTIDSVLRLSERQSGSYIAGLMQLLEDMLPEDVLADQVPKRFEIDQRVLWIEPRIVRDNEGRPIRLLMSINDISELESAQREARANTTLIEVLRSKEAFVRFLGDTKNSLNFALEEIKDQSTVRRILHTVKGNASSFGLDHIAQRAHEIEEDEYISEQKLRAILALFSSFLETNKAVLELDFESLDNSKFEVCQESIEELRGISRTSNDRALRAWAAKITLKPASCILGPVDSFIYKLASRLDKVVTFETHGLDTRIDQEIMGPVLRTVTHLLRNAIDHGLEDATQRGEKDPMGRVSLSVSETPLYWQLEVSDDGAGVDIQAVVERAITLGKISRDEVENLSKQEKTMLLFLDGVSSRDRITEISGRGVGTSAVLIEARRAGGHVEVHTTVGQGSRFVIQIPKPEPLIQDVAAAV